MANWADWADLADLVYYPKVNRLPRLLSALLPLIFIFTGSCQAAPPSTFGTTVGYTLLCLNSLNEIYFRQYLTQTFGQPYKREEGAYWFKSNAKLWGIPVTDVLVSDETSEYTFLAAVLDSKPDKLNDAIANVAGIRHASIGTNAFPVRQAQAGSQIIHFQQKSKIFCSRSRYLVPN